MEDYNMAKNVARQFFLTDAAIDRDDLAQIAALAIFKAKNHYDPSRGEFSTFAYRAAKNAIISYLKSTARHNSFSIRSESVYDDVSLDEYINDKWTDNEIETMRKRLDGHSIQEIADQMQCSVATVNNRLRSGRNRIRKQIK